MLKRKFRCSGVKICEHLDPELRTMQHTKVSEAVWQEVRNRRNAIYFSEQNPKRKGAVK